MLRRFLGKNNLDKRGFLVITILFLSVFGWYYMAVPMIKSVLGDLDITSTQNLAIWATFYLSIIGASVIGTFLSNKVDRFKFLYAWTVSGAVISLLPALPIDASFLYVWSVSLLLGASFGLGIPSCLAYFADCTLVENRGRVSGITFLIANLSVPLLSVLFISNIDLAILSVIFALLRGTGLIVHFLQPNKQPSSQTTRNVSFISILRDRNFLFYFAAWSMFPLLDSFERVIIDNFLVEWNRSLIYNMEIVEPLVACLAILVAGLLCDWIGRKKIVLSGFVALGFAYAVIGFNPYSVFSWYLYFLVDAIAWGIFLLVFVLILWGDLAKTDNSEKYYMLGSISYFLSSIIPSLLPEPFIDNISLYASFSLAALFLFVAVMPLVFAPETLPEKKMELRRLRSFAEEARKAREKYERKKEK